MLCWCFCYRRLVLGDPVTKQIAVLQQEIYTEIWNDIPIFTDLVHKYIFYYPWNEWNILIVLFIHEELNCYGTWFIFLDNSALIVIQIFHISFWVVLLIFMQSVLCRNYLNVFLKAFIYMLFIFTKDYFIYWTKWYNYYKC